MGFPFVKVCRMEVPKPGIVRSPEGRPRGPLGPSLGPSLGMSAALPSGLTPGFMRGASSWAWVRRGRERRRRVGRVNIMELHWWRSRL